MMPKETQKKETKYETQNRINGYGLLPNSNRGEVKNKKKKKAFLPDISLVSIMRRTQLRPDRVTTNDAINGSAPTLGT